MLLRFIALLGLAIWACRCTRKQPKNDIGTWLEQHFPGRFQVMGTQVSDPIRNLSFQVKKSLVAEKADTAVQVEIIWDKRAPHLGIDQSEVEEMAARAETQIKDARAIYASLQASGFERANVGIWRGNVTLLLYDTPTPDFRKTCLKNLEKSAAQWPARDKYGLAVYFLEPHLYQKEESPVKTLDFWRLPSLFLPHASVYLHVDDPIAALNISSLANAWTLHTESKALSDFVQNVAQPAAAEWGKRHLSKPITLLNRWTYEPLKDPTVLGLQMKFPYTYGTLSDDAPVDGCIGGQFLFDAQTFSTLNLCKWNLY